MKKKEEVTITFYAAECGEFHDLGEYTKCRTLEEAYKKYQKYCRTSANMCPAIEFSIHDPESIYSDMEYPLPLSSKDRGIWNLCHITTSIHWQMKQSDSWSSCRNSRKKRNIGMLPDEIRDTERG